MSTSTSAPTIAERTDIHKSCKSIETLLNILNEYCEAVGAVVSLQKKLAKSLRETAALKVTGDIPANAMQASANIFESLSDVDSKFSKIADKEYDSISSEVKKWFKKLAKEEKTHDERIAVVNAKIKQAGQAYEKKSKRKTSDAAEEHTRYINLISTLGPEVSQEKYNHSLTVTQKHSTATYSIASCLSRLADAEWQKSCECTRRFAPTIGPLTEWRALCEGGWAGPVPRDLPDHDAPTGQAAKEPSSSANTQNVGLKTIEEEPKQRYLEPPPTAEPRQSTEPLRSSTDYFGQVSERPSGSPNEELPSANNSPLLPRQAPPAAVSNHKDLNLQPSIPATQLLPPKFPLEDPNTGSIRSLSAFPAPPTHFPPPRQHQPSDSLVQSRSSSGSQLQFPSSRQLAESPVSGNEDTSALSDNERRRNQPPVQTPHSPPSPERRFQERQRAPESKSKSDDTNDGLSPSMTGPLEIRRPIPLRSQTALPTVDSDLDYSQDSDAPVRTNRGHVSSSSVDRKPLYMKAQDRDNQADDGREFGMNSGILTKARTYEGLARSTRPIERTDTGTSNGSIVAAMRSRYTSNPGTTSPPPRELPQIPLSVNSLATRYQAEPPVSPHGNRIGSPTVFRQQSLPLLDTLGSSSPQDSRYPAFSRIPSISRRVDPASTPTQDDERRRRQRNGEVVDLNLNQKEQQFRDREMELEMRSRELDRERQRLQNLREGTSFDPRQESYNETNVPQQQQQGHFGLKPRERRTSLRAQLQRPLSQMELDEGNGATNGSRSPPLSSPSRPRTQNLYPGAHLSPPSASNVHTPPSSSPLHSPTMDQRQIPQPSSPARNQTFDPRYERAMNNDRYGEDSGSSNANSNTQSSNASTSMHAPYCGCETCSVNKYKSSSPSSPTSSTQQGGRPMPKYAPIEGKPVKEKSKANWIRRLSMPVGSAFSSDSKKHQHQSNSSIGSIASASSSTYALGGGPESKGLYAMDPKKNMSAVALRSPGQLDQVQEDGRLGVRPGVGMNQGRRSYEASGISNRSMTNLGVSGGNR